MNLSTVFLLDFENLPDTDLSPAVEMPAQVKLFLGRHQTKLKVKLVQLIQRLGDRCEMIEVAKPGRNALDLTLACHLGQAIERDRTIQFVIVSGDTDFDPLISHLTDQGIAIRRALALSEAQKPRTRTGKTAVPFPAKIKQAAPPKVPASDPKLEKLIDSFRRDPKRCPRKIERLRHVIFTHYGKKITEPEQTALVRKLEKGGVIKVEGEVVVCLLGPPLQP